MVVLQINNCHYRRGGADVVYLNTGELLEKHGQKVIYFALYNDKNDQTMFSNYFPKGIDYRGLSLSDSEYKKMSRSCLDLLI